MKTPVLLFFLLAALSCGCSAQKSAPKTASSRTAYAEALAALQTRRFDIEACEFRYTSGKKDPVTSTNSFVRMRGDRGTVDFGLHIYRRAGLVDEELYDAQAVLTEEKPARNGDPQFTLLLSDASNTKRIRMSIRLYKNTNACFVNVYYYEYKNPYNFRGYIHPAGVRKQPVVPADNTGHATGSE